MASIKYYCVKCKKARTNEKQKMCLDCQSPFIPLLIENGMIVGFVDKDGNEQYYSSEERNISVSPNEKNTSNEVSFLQNEVPEELNRAQENESEENASESEEYNGVNNDEYEDWIKEQRKKEEKEEIEAEKYESSPAENVEELLRTIATLKREVDILKKQNHSPLPKETSDDNYNPTHKENEEKKSSYENSNNVKVPLTDKERIQQQVRKELEKRAKQQADEEERQKFEVAYNIEQQKKKDAEKKEIETQMKLYEKEKKHEGKTVSVKRTDNFYNDTPLLEEEIPKKSVKTTVFQILGIALVVFIILALVVVM